jgi:hypothetical protein
MNIFDLPESSCTLMPFVSHPYYYSLQASGIQERISAKMFCSDALCTKCRHVINDQALQVCFAFNYLNYRLSAYLRREDENCYGGINHPDIDPNGFVLLQFGAPGCTAQTSVLMTYLTQTEGNCIANPFWHNLTLLPGSNSYGIATDCQQYCQACETRGTMALSQCVATPGNTSAKLFPAVQLPSCAILIKSESLSMGIIIGISIGAVAALLVAAMIIRRQFFSQVRVVYIRLPTTDSVL